MLIVKREMTLDSTKPTFSSQSKPQIPMSQNCFIKRWQMTILPPLLYYLNYIIIKIKHFVVSIIVFTIVSVIVSAIISASFPSSPPSSPLSLHHLYRCLRIVSVVVSASSQSSRHLIVLQFRVSASMNLQGIIIQL